MKILKSRFREFRFLARAKRCHKEDAVAFDSSTVSSYSRYIKETRQGFNKAGDGLDTLKLLTLLDLATHQPIAFAREPGNLADVSRIENAIKQFSFLNISKAQIVTDKGYYSQNNIGQMLLKHINDNVPVPLQQSSKAGENRKFTRLEIAATSGNKISFGYGTAL